NRARARRTADAGELPIVQRIVRQPPRADVLPHLGLGPLEQRAHLVQAALGVPLDGLGRGACGRPLAPQPGAPAVAPGVRALEGLDLADATALEACLEAVIETV